MSNFNTDLAALKAEFRASGTLPFPIPEILANVQGLLLARDEERRVAPELLLQIKDLPNEQALDRIASDTRFHAWGLAELLIEQSRQSIFAADPTEAVRFAKLATFVALKVDTTLYGRALAADFATQAWAALANAQRCAGYLSEAEASFHEANGHLTEGTGDPLEAANLLSLTSSLRMELGEYAEASALLDEAIAIYRDIEDPFLLGRSLLKKAIAEGIQDPERGLRILPDCLRYLQFNQDPRTFLCARNTQIHLLLDAGRPAEAEQVLETSRLLYRQVGGDWLVLRLAWLEAKICCGLGRLDEADAGLHVILTEVMERKLPLESALAALDLAQCRILQGRSREAAEMARSMAGMFAAWGVHRRALEAWAVVQEALATETATATLLRDVAGYLARAWRNPDISFSVSI